VSPNAPEPSDGMIPLQTTIAILPAHNEAENLPNVLAELGGKPRRPHTARARANHEEIIVVRRHR